jgi:hypothetical protein
MESSKVELKGGAGAADYVISAIGGIGQQTHLAGSNVIAPKVGGSPLAPAVYGGKKSKKQQKQQKQQSKKEKKVDGGKKQEKKQEKKVDGGKKQEKKQEKKVDGGKKQEEQQEKQEKQEQQQEKQESSVDGGSILVDLALPAAFIGATHLYKKGKTSKMIPSQFRGRLYSRRMSRTRR